MRAFVAVEVTGPEEARGRAPAHLTLRFLGEIAPERLDAALPALREAVRGSAPFRLRLDGIGAFPSADRPRVVWQGVSAGREELLRLADRVRKALEPAFGVEREPFVPHLTLFRVRSARDRTDADDLLQGRRAPPPARDVTVAVVRVKESVLGAGGAVHRTLATLPLGGAPAE